MMFFAHYLQSPGISATSVSNIARRKATGVCHFARKICEYGAVQLSTMPIHTLMLFNISMLLAGSVPDDISSDDTMSTSDHESEDPTYIPSSAEDSDPGDEFVPHHGTTADPVKERKYIVWESQLDKLFTKCHTCNEPTQVTKSEHGSLVTVKAVCANDHVFIWDSQPSIGRGRAKAGAGGWLIPSAILLCGGLFSAFFFTFCKLAEFVVCQSEFLLRDAEKIPVSCRPPCLDTTPNRSARFAPPATQSTSLVMHVVTVPATVPNMVSSMKGVELNLF